MRILKKQIWQIFLGAAFLMTACQKDEIPVYSADERINFNYDAMQIRAEKGVYNDTLLFSMGFSSEEYAEVDLEFILIGYAKDYEREVGLSISGDVDYVGKVLDIPEKIVLPKNEIKVTVPCRILVNDFLREGDKAFYLKLMDSKELLAGNQTTVCLKASTDVPSSWVGDSKWWYYDVETFFGECSKEKYRFVHSVLGIWDFSVWEGTGFSSGMGDPNKFNPAKKLLKKELAKHEAEFGPIMDPDKGQVTFPD